MATHAFTERKMSRAELLRNLVDRLRARRLAGKVVFAVLAADGINPYPVTYPYGVPNAVYAAGRHTGEDHACPVGSLAVATSWGEVVYAGDAAANWGSAYGNQVVIRMANGKYDYAHNHLSSVLVTAGQKVEPGTVVGLTGATGNVTGPHTHFEARFAGGHYGSDVDPIRVKVRRKKA